MGQNEFAYDLGSYKYSDTFSEIHSESSLKSLAFSEFLEEGDSLVKTKQSDLDAKLYALYEKDEEEGQIFEQHDHYLGSTINETLEESFLLAATSYLFSQFEYLIFEIAKKTGELYKSKINPDEYENKCKRNNKGISKALAFIQEITGISFIEENHKWSDIKQFQRIRNCIVHSNGIVKSNYDGLDSYAISKKGLVFNKDQNQIKVEKEYLLELGNTCFKFLDTIMEKVWKNKPENDPNKSTIIETSHNQQV
jgi:hypothetical protein